MTFYNDFLATSGSPLIFSFGPRGMVLWVIGPSVVAAAIFFIGHKLRIPAIKWAAFLFLLFGMAVGIQASINMGDPIYSDFYDLNSKRRTMHVATAIVPFVTAIALFVWNKLLTKAPTNRL